MTSYFVMYMKDYLRMNVELVPFFVVVVVDLQKQMRSFRYKVFY